MEFRSKSNKNIFICTS